MIMDITTTVQELINSYRRYYDIHEEEAASFPELAARCDLHMTQSNYVLSKKNVLWSADSHEYCYIFEAEHLYLDTYRRFEDYVYRNGMELIDPKPGHMCSVLSVIVICKSASPDARRAMKHCHIHKNFRFSLDGWMDMRTGLLELESGHVVTNMSGHEAKKHLQQLAKTS